MEKMKKSIVFLFGFVLMGAGSLPDQQSMAIGNVINDIAGNLASPLRGQLPERSKTAVISFNAGFPALSDHVTEGITAGLVKFSF